MRVGIGTMDQASMQKTGQWQIPCITRATSYFIGAILAARRFADCVVVFCLVNRLCHKKYRSNISGEIYVAQSLEPPLQLPTANIHLFGKCSTYRGPMSLYSEQLNMKARANSFVSLSLSLEICCHLF